ncbi:ABC transporter substrate-binding protein [Opitutae bacterium]|nr:ABC transporter substrate-binding protein [Opitutae bacterium]
MKIFRLFFSVLAFLIANQLCAINDPLIKIKETSESVLDILYSESQDIDKEILVYLSKNYNLNIMIRRTLGRNWNKINSLHQNKIVDLIKRLVLRAYINGMDGKMKPEIKYSKIRYLSEKRAEVPTFVYLSNKPLAITYRVGLVSDQWEIFDIVVENISIVLTYRNQFDAFFDNNTSEALIEKLEILLTKENLGQSLPIY